MMRLQALIMMVLLMGCAHGHCQKESIEAKKAESDSVTTPPASELKTMVKPSQAERVKIYKADGSLQCGKAKGQSPREMQNELGNIEVFSSSSQSDGMMRIQVCGAPTGQCNVYEISRQDLPQALKKGFKEWVK